MTDREWKKELEGALASSALPWRVTAAWVEQVGTVLCADLLDIRSGQERTVRISRLVFTSEPERREEIARLLQGRG